MKVIAVDVDLCVVDSLTPWMEWFKQFTDKPVLNESKSYNLVPEMKAILEQEGLKDYVDPISFWRKPDLYDNLEPVEGAVEALRAVAEQKDYLSARRNHLIFISSCFPEHEHSKVRFLEKYFPFKDAFISTHDKHFVGYDVLIDDKIEHMRLGMKYRPGRKHILFTGVRADGTEYARMPYQKMNHWSKLDRLLNPPNKQTIAFAPGGYA